MGYVICVAAGLFVGVVGMALAALNNRLKFDAALDWLDRYLP